MSPTSDPDTVWHPALGQRVKSEGGRRDRLNSDAGLRGTNGQCVFEFACVCVLPAELNEIHTKGDKT